MRRILALGLAVALIVPALTGCSLGGSPEGAIERGLEDIGLEPTQVLVNKGYNGFNAELSVDLVLASPELSAQQAVDLLSLVLDAIDPGSYSLVTIAAGHDPVGELDRLDIVPFDLHPAAESLGLVFGEDPTPNMIRAYGEKLAEIAE